MVQDEQGCLCAVQSSLLGLLLASRFFDDPLVCLPCGISTIFMTLVSAYTSALRGPGPESLASRHASSL